MKITLQAPNSHYKTHLDIEHQVLIRNPSIGPILTNGPLCVTLFARDSGFEGYIWNTRYNTPDFDDVFKTDLPDDAIPFTMNEDGIYVRVKGT